MTIISGAVVVAVYKRLKRSKQGIGHVRRYQSGHDGRYIEEVMDERGTFFDLLCVSFRPLETHQCQFRGRPSFRVRRRIDRPSPAMYRNFTP